ncbi:hypothetical protein Vadar_002765 [Vaccinium darrowii]|uniref:Uncharacterized protein n=1 Tax=Vaccinium darrowii TaxID=229202 RepID=A0ACB7ZI06_9ERIC|nr:hypothetical protein Vadar_002765 [Vaccinium darrowii]
MLSALTVAINARLPAVPDLDVPTRDQHARDPQYNNKVSADTNYPRNISKSSSQSSSERQKLSQGPSNSNQSLHNCYDGFGFSKQGDKLKLDEEEANKSNTNLRADLSQERARNNEKIDTDDGTILIQETKEEGEGGLVIMEQREVVSLNKTVFEETEEEATTKRSVECINGSNNAELTKVALMRAFIEKQDPSSNDIDDYMIRRFLRARDRDIEKASAMVLKYLKWKRTFMPTGSISASEIATDLEQKKVFTQGLDITGRPIMVAFAGRHFPRKGGLEEFKRFVVFSIDKVCSRMPEGQEKFAFIGDLEGWGYANSDIHGLVGALTILQDYYPERLGKLFLIHVPYIFMALWKVVYPFIDNNTKKKIVFVDNKKLKSTLLEDIDESQLPEIYGGKLQLVPIQGS